MENPIKTCGYACPYFGIKDSSDYTGKCKLHELFRTVRFGDPCHENQRYESKISEKRLETVAA
jgi:hypothetical protein